MPHGPAISELPRSLQEMIADARNAVDNWQHDDLQRPVIDDQLSRTMYDWTLQLSQGEYEEHTYWECVAEDAEIAGEWARAKLAYRTILGLPDARFYWGKAHRGLAILDSHLGAPKEALKHLHAASLHEYDNGGNVFYRVSIAREAWCLLKLGRVRSAESTLRRGMSTFKAGHSDYINYATLHIVSAACQIARHSLSNAKDLLKTAHSALEILVPHADKANAGCGSLSAYAWWWQAEANRCRAAKLPNEELAALRQRLDYARLATNGWKRLDLDANVMHAWDDLADAYDHRGLHVEATEARSEAAQIQNQWHLPTLQKPQPGLLHRIAAILRTQPLAPP